MSEANGGGSSRLAHEGEVLQALRQSAELSQPQLAHRTGLARGTVINIVDKLEAKDLVESREGHSGPHGGRPGKVVRLRAKEGFGLGVHFGHRHVRVSCGDLIGYQVFFFFEESVAPTIEAEVNVGADGRRSLDAAVGLIEQAMVRMEKEEGRGVEDLVAVTVGWPAPVTDVEANEAVIDDSMQEWHGIGPAARNLQSMLGWTEVPFLTENDANLGALMELEHGVGREHKDFLYIHWNSGLGGAIVADRHLVRGGGGLGGEIGHIPVEGEGRGERCPRCGSDHCLELLAGGAAVVAAFNRRARVRVENLREVIELADSGGADSEIAQSELQAAGRLIGKAVGPVLTVTNPAAIVIGGHLGKGEDGADHHHLIAEAFRHSLLEHSSSKAMQQLNSIGASEWRYGAAQGGVVLGMRRKLERLLEVRERRAG